MVTVEQQTELPAAVQCYFEAVAADNAEAVALCFARDAVISDVDPGVFTICAAQRTGKNVSVLLTFKPHHVVRSDHGTILKSETETIIKADLQYA